MDPRFERLANLMVNYSTGVSKGDIVIVDSSENVPVDMALATIRAVRESGGQPISWRSNAQITAELLKGCDKRQLRIMGLGDLVQLSAADACIIFRGFSNIFELGGVPGDDMKLHAKHYIGMVLDERVENTRWVLSRWPTPAMAQLAGMPTSEFEDFFFKACLANYKAMALAVRPLWSLMERTDKVHIKGPGTDLRFSIKGIPVIVGVGKHNIPDGEIYTAPVRESAKGTIAYNTRTITKEGQVFEGISFTIESGKITKATCRSGDEARLNKILDTDEGARYFGEFSLGLNWEITKTIGETLFDEKVGGTFHFTPGRCYDQAPNGNESNIHWDIVLDQREEQGGGKIYFDGKLIRDNGLFVPRSLQGLNPKR